MVDGFNKAFSNEAETPEPEINQPGPEPETIEAEAETLAVDPVNAETEQPKPEKRQPTVDEFKAILDEREKRQSLERELERTRAELTKLQPQPEREKLPDQLEDPEGFATSIEQRIAQAERVAFLKASEVAYRNTLGAEKFEEVRKWAFERAQSDPGFAQKGFSSDPWGEAIQAFEEAKEFEEFKAWKQTKTAVPPVAETKAVIPPNVLGKGGAVRDPGLPDQSSFFTSVFSR